MSIFIFHYFHNPREREVKRSFLFFSMENYYEIFTHLSFYEEKFFRNKNFVHCEKLLTTSRNYYLWSTFTKHAAALLKLFHLTKELKKKKNQSWNLDRYFVFSPSISSPGLLPTRHPGEGSQVGFRLTSTTNESLSYQRSALLECQLDSFRRYWKSMQSSEPLPTRHICNPHHRGRWR